MARGTPGDIGQLRSRATDDAAQLLERELRILTNRRMIHYGNIGASANHTLRGASLLSTNTAASSAIANTSTETAFSLTGSIPANILEAGDTLMLELWGTYGTDALLAPTIRGRVKLDGATVLDTGSITTLVGITGSAWNARVSMKVYSKGATGTIDAQGALAFATAVTAALAVNVADTSPLTVDTTQDLDVTVTVEWGTADTDNTITCRQFALWLASAI